VSRMMGFADGGALDNLAVMPLLRRRVKCLIVLAAASHAPSSGLETFAAGEHLFCLRTFCTRRGLVVESLCPVVPGSAGWHREKPRKPGACHNCCEAINGLSTQHLSLRCLWIPSLPACRGERCGRALWCCTELLDAEHHSRAPERAEPRVWQGRGRGAQALPGRVFAFEFVGKLGSKKIGCGCWVEECLTNVGAWEPDESQHVWQGRGRGAQALPGEVFYWEGRSGHLVTLGSGVTTL
jgi:hypothetical protein